MKKNAVNIFYADDDLDDREFFESAVREVSPSFNLITHSDGNELIDMLNNPPPFPNILFLDLNMPIKNGFEVLKEIRQSERTRDIPVVVFSTSDDAEAINTTRQLGANLYVPKPNTYTGLKKVIMHSMSIDWSKFTPSIDQFVYRVK
jgi:CheY-like chemotaxis protein